MPKISKNQRTDRGRGQQVKMAKVVVAEKKPNGQYRFREQMVPLDEVKRVAQAR